jgi:hypothetical protein
MGVVELAATHDAWALGRRHTTPPSQLLLMPVFGRGGCSVLLLLFELYWCVCIQLVTCVSVCVCVYGTEAALCIEAAPSIKVAQSVLEWGYFWRALLDVAGSQTHTTFWFQCGLSSVVSWRLIAHTGPQQQGLVNTCDPA